MELKKRKRIIQILAAVVCIGVAICITGCQDSKHVVIKPGTTVIKDKAFEGKKGIESVEIPDSVTSIGLSAFAGCTGLTSITIPDSVQLIENNAFEDCSGLKEIVLPNSIPFIGMYAFKGCTSLTEITIPDSVTDIRTGALKDCSGLEIINIPDSVSYIGDSAFKGCTNLTEIIIPNSVTTIESNAFENCTGLTNITIPDSVTKIGHSLFYGCTELKSLSLPGNCDKAISKDIQYDNIYITGTSVPDKAFEQYSMKNVTIMDSVTSIGEMAFFQCPELSSVTISDSVVSIGERAFIDCTALTDLSFSNGADIGNLAFAGTGLNRAVEDVFPQSLEVQDSIDENIKTLAEKKVIPLKENYSMYLDLYMLIPSDNRTIDCKVADYAIIKQVRKVPRSDYVYDDLFSPLNISASANDTVTELYLLGRDGSTKLICSITHEPPESGKVQSGESLDGTEATESELWEQISDLFEKT